VLSVGNVFIVAYSICVVLIILLFCLNLIKSVCLGGRKPVPRKMLGEQEEEWNVSAGMV
jgi:hypothetical protein